MEDLKLFAFDETDLTVISAHLQDAVMKVGDIAYLPKSNRFALVARRFDWQQAEEPARAHGGANYLRRLTALRFERVQNAQFQGLDPRAREVVLNLLAIQFEPADLPGGYVTLHFAGGADIRLEVECLELEMSDLGATWASANRPSHPDDADSPEQ
jgi:hypothetical protein